jgi:uncharacterized protein (TIGR03000 family)
MKGRVLLGGLVLLAVAETVWAQVPVFPVLLVPAKPAVPARAARIRVLVPSPDATVWFDDVLMAPRGMDRLYFTPPLGVGRTYSYNVKASWMADTRPVVREQRIRFRPGDEVVVSFLGDVGKVTPALRPPRTRVAVPRQAVPTVEARRPILPAVDFTRLSPTRGYIRARQNLDRPSPLLGGPLTVHVAQKAADVHVILPDSRRLDPVVFGTPDLPRAFGGTPVAEGVPPALRAQKDGRYTATTRKAPFGDKYVVLKEGGRGEIGLAGP